jgi:PleD family two-component response regulator
MEKMKKDSILIVDDEKANVFALAEILEPLYSVIIERDGEGAIETANESIPDIILLDVLMPDMDGYAVIKELKNSEKTRHIPVIFITGLSEANDEKKGLALGAADYISKPLSPAIVELRVRNQLQIIRQMRELDKQFRQQSLMSSISQSFLDHVRELGSGNA